jgi:hypothetical protein
MVMEIKLSSMEPGPSSLIKTEEEALGYFPDVL